MGGKKHTELKRPRRTEGRRGGPVAASPGDALKTEDVHLAGVPRLVPLSIEIAGATIRSQDGVPHTYTRASFLQEMPFI